MGGVATGPIPITAESRTECHTEHMTSPDPHRRDEGSQGSYYYPETPPATRQYSASDYDAERGTDPGRQSDRAAVQRRARRDAAERERKRLIAARSANTIIQVVCYVFAVVLAIHIVLVIGDANAGNGFYQFIDSWRSGITLGFDDLFVPQNYKFRITLNQGLAAIVWIIIGIVLSTLVRRLLTPIPRGNQSY